MLTCPACGQENPADARFCNACGGPLSAAQPVRKERKFATALFADLVGSTTLAEQEDPEVVQSVVGRTFDRMSEEITRHEGLLEKFMGDAVLAVFGVPRAHEDDAERAVRAALEMQGVLVDLNRRFAAEGKPTLQMRIGLEAGEVLVDVERASGARDRMLTGDAVNTAARLQSAAQPDQIVVGPTVYATTKDVIEYQELEPLSLKGKAERVLAWRVLRIKARTRGERPRLGMEAHLTGRDEELTVLKQTLQRVQTDARPALLTVIGPAGVGKSRLVAELEHHVEGLPEIVYWRRGRCLAYANTSYSALADAIKAQCEIFEDDSTDVAGSKVDGAVRELFGDDSIVPQLRALVGAGESRDMSREELFDAWRRFLERLASRYPLVLVLDDIHWADEGLLDFVDHVADYAQGPIMVVATARAELLERRPTWGGGKRNATSIYLDPLSTAEGEAMLDDLLPGPVEPALKQQIVERSEGNPLYIEEIVRKLIDDGVLRATAASRWEVARSVADIELPRSVQGLIAARLDGLPDDEKAVLQDAAVIGRVFWVGAVAQLTGKSVADVREALSRLRVKELVVPHDPSSFRDEPEFAFRHALIRDGAYDSLPKALRADMHLGVARWAEERAGDRAEEIAELVATHETEAIRYLDELGERRTDVERKAFGDAWAAARRTVALQQIDEAVRWYREAELLADRLDISPKDRAPLAREHAARSWGPDDMTETERVTRRAIEIFEAAGDQQGVGWATSQLVIPLMQQARHDEAEQAGLAGIAILETLGPGADLAAALHRLGWFYWRRGNHGEAEHLASRSVEMSLEHGSPLTHAEAVQTLSMVMMATQRVDEGRSLMEEAFQLAKAVGDPTNLMRAYNNYIFIVQLHSGPATAEPIVREGLDLALRSGIAINAGWLSGTLGDLLDVMGRLAEAEDAQRRAVEVAKQVGDEPLTGQRLSGLASVLVQRLKLDEAIAVRNEAAPLLEANREPQSDHFLPWVDGHLALARGDLAAAAELFVRSADLAITHGIDAAPEVPVAAVLALMRIGDQERALKYAHIERLAEGAQGAPHARHIEGLLEPDPAKAIPILRDAVAHFERLDMRVFAARTSIDLARAMIAAGQDAGEELSRAREALVAADAKLFLADLDELTATRLTSLTEKA